MCVPGAFDCSPAYYCKRGIALYRTDFTLEQNAPDALLKLGGLGLRARFWIDGREIGFTNLPYSGVEFKTGKLTAGKHTLWRRTGQPVRSRKNEAVPALL